MSKISSILLTVTFVFILMKPNLPYLEYIFRYDFIVENLCINREKPETKCDGKCHLNRQLQKESEHSEDNDMPLRPKKTQNELPEYIKAETEQKDLRPVLLSIVESYIKNYAYQFAASIFHPPTG
jgi:hypothetical protein